MKPDPDRPDETLTHVALFCPALRDLQDEFRFDELGTFNDLVRDKDDKVLQYLDKAMLRLPLHLRYVEAPLDRAQGNPD